LILKRITDIFILFEVQQSKRGFYKMIRRQFLSLLLLLTILTFHCTHLKNAHQAYEENNYRQVITLCRQAIASDSTDTEAYLVAPEEMAEELLDLMGHRVEVTGTVIEEEDRPPIIEVDSYTEVYDETEEEEEEEEEEGEGVSAEADLED